MKRFPRPVKRFPREPKRFPRIDYSKYNIERKGEFPKLYNSNKKPKDKYPHLYEELKRLRDLFTKRGWRLDLYCPFSKSVHISSLEICICRCKTRRCPMLTFKNIMSDGDSNVAEFIDSFTKFQRLSNIIYGTVRVKDMEPVDDVRSDKKK